MPEPLPKKLEEALQNQPRYKHVYKAPESVLSSILNDQSKVAGSAATAAPLNTAYSFERNLLDKLVGGRDNFNVATNDICANDGSLFPKRPPRSNVHELSQNRTEALSNAHKNINIQTTIDAQPTMSGLQQDKVQRDQAAIASMASRLNQLEKVLAYILKWTMLL
jgi:hypothetical protein